MKALNQNTCPSDDQLSWAFSMEANDDIRAHVATCPACAHAWAALQQPGSLARALPVAPLADLSRQRVRARLMTETPRFASPARLPARWLVGAGSVLAAAACLALVWWLRAESAPNARVMTRGTPTPTTATGAPPQPGPAHHRGRLRAHAGAGFLRVNAQPDEIVRLDEGKLTVEVQPLARGERFRVITGDGEVEVHGTAFDVEAHQDRLQGVRVLHGRVEVRVGNAPSVFLNAGERWTRPEEIAAPAAPVAVAHAVRPTPARAPRQIALAVREATPGASRTSPDRGAVSMTPSPPPSPRVTQTRSSVTAPATAPPAPTPPPETHSPAPAEFAPTPGERDFHDGWTALTARSPARAADGFARAVQSSRGTALEEDARFWHGVALARAGRAAAARQALGEFLAGYPTSPRHGEASAMLGWLLLDAGDGPGARRRFQAAERDPVVEVRQSAAKGLAAVANRETSH